jgi:hypothetical protein
MSHHCRRMPPPESRTPRVHPGVLRSLSFRFTERSLGAPAPTCLVGSMENGSRNAREIRSQNAAKPFVTGSETDDRTALHGRAAPGREKKPPTKTQLRSDSNTNRTPAPIIGQLQPGWQMNLPCAPTWHERSHDLLRLLHWLSIQFCQPMGWQTV